MPISPEEVEALLSELAVEVESRGDLPKPKENPEFWSKLDILIRELKNSELGYTMKDVADRLGVGRAKLQKLYREWQDMARAKSEEQGQPPPEPVSIEPPAPKEEMGERVMERYKDEGMVRREEAPRKVEDRVFGKGLETSVSKTITGQLKKTVDQVAKEEVEKIYRVGRTVVSEYEAECIRQGYEDLEACVHAAFTALTEAAPRLAETEASLNACAEAMAKALPYVARGILYEKVLETLKDLIADPGVSPEVRSQLLRVYSRMVIKSGRGLGNAGEKRV